MDEYIFNLAGIESFHKKTNSRRRFWFNHIRKNALKKDGDIFFSTINRNPKSYLFAIIGAEYVLKLLPRGTHDYQKFIKPSELAKWIRDSRLIQKETIGLSYNPISNNYWLGKDIQVNYMVHATKEED